MLQGKKIHWPCGALYAKKFRQITKPHTPVSRVKTMRDDPFLEILISLAVISISKIGNHFHVVQKWHQSSHGNPYPHQ